MSIFSTTYLSDLLITTVFLPLQGVYLFVQSLDFHDHIILEFDAGLVKFPEFFAHLFPFFRQSISNCKNIPDFKVESEYLLPHTG